MKVAFLISAYTDPKQLGNMVEALDGDGHWLYRFFVHIDKKVDAKPFADAVGAHGGVTFCSRRLAVNWGGYNQVLYQRELLRSCIESGEDFDRVFILSGQDYPLWSVYEITAELEANPQKEYILGLDITNVNEPKSIRRRITRYHFFRDASPRSIKLRKLSRIVMGALPFRKKPYVTVGGERWDVYQSSGYLCITMELARYVYKTMTERRELERYFKTSYVPEEMVIPTIVFNSPFRERAMLYPPQRYDGLKYLSAVTYFNYGKAIQVFNETNYDELMSSGKMFARKFSSTESARLMEMLKERWNSGDQQGNGGSHPKYLSPTSGDAKMAEQSAAMKLHQDASLDRKLRVLIFHPYLATYRVDLYNHLAEDFNLRVELLGSDHEIKGLGFDLDRVNKSARFPYEYYNKGFYVGRHLVSCIYFKLIREFRPDVVICHELGINTLATICLRGIRKFRIFATIDDSPDMAHRAGRMRRWLQKFVMSRIDGAITVNPLVTESLRKKYGGGRFQSIHFPIIQDDKILSAKINAAKSQAEQYIEKYRLANRKIVLFVGRLEKIKNTPWLAEQFAQLDAGDATLVIVGDGSEREAVRTVVRSSKASDRIIMTGSLSGNELYAWFYIAHILVLPSSSEAFGAVVNEGLVAGCRAIVSDKVGGDFLITDSNGSVFPLGDGSEFKKCLVRELQCVDLEKKHKSLMPQPFEYYYNNLVRHIKNEN